MFIHEDLHGVHNTWEWEVLTNIVPWPLSTYKYERDIHTLSKGSKETKQLIDYYDYLMGWWCVINPPLYTV
jgi:hypothetical protein